MARGVNKVILVGTLGKDPEVRYSQAGAAMTSISVATNESWKDKVTGEKQERTEWHRVKFFGRLAEIAGEYLKKGGQVYIEGSLRTEKYTDKQGVEKYSTDIIASELQMLGGQGGDRDRDEGGDSRASGSRGGGSAQRESGRGDGGGYGGGGGNNSGGGNQQRGAANQNTTYGHGHRGAPVAATAGGGSDPFPDDD